MFKGEKNQMNKTKKTKEKTCTFYASDYHFEMISLPFISKKLEEKKEIIVLTENNLENTIKTLLSKTNLNKSKKEDILKINWKENNLEKFKKIKQNTEEKKETIIFIKGKENYIKNIKENIEKWTQNSPKTKVIDCYDINEIQAKADEIISKYENLLGTSGEKKI